MDMWLLRLIFLEMEEQHMKKKILSLVLAAAMVFGVTGCESAINSEKKTGSSD